MSVASDSAVAQVGDVASCRQWLEALPDEVAPRLAAIGTLLARLGRARVGADPLFEMLELVRVEQVRAIDRWLAPLAARAVPYADDEWQRVGSALASLRASRDLFKRAHSLMLGRDGERSTIAGATDALRVVMPLARALDAQARLVSLLLRHRSAPLVADWDALCVLARHMRRTTFQDETLLDEVPLVKPVTARALFVYPLLLLGAALSSRPVAEAGIAERLAGRLAAKVGFRIDEHARESNPHGPTLLLTPRYAVRLDTHRLPASIERRRLQVRGAGSPSGRSMPLSEGAVDALLADLEQRWTGAVCADSRGVQAAPGAGAPSHCAGSARLRLGLPRMHAADLKAVEQSQAPVPGSDTRYLYGGWEQNTIVQLMLGGQGQRDEPAVRAMAEAETVGGVESRPGDRLVVERHGPTRRVLLGGLVAIAPDAGLRLGTIESIEQIPDVDYLRLRGHRLVVRCWPGQPVPAGVRIDAALSFADAWLLPGDPAAGELPSLVLAPGRARVGARALLRERDRDAPVRFASLIERGPGYERVSLRSDSQLATAASTPGSQPGAAQVVYGNSRR